MKKAILLFLLTAPMLGAAQSVTQDSLRWKVTAFHNEATNEDLTLSCEFETNINSIKWIQKNGTRVYDFTITSTDGTWSDVSQKGQVTYSVTFGEYAGWIKFWRTGEGLGIQTHIDKEGGNMLPYSFTISEILTR